MSMHADSWTGPWLGAAVVSVVRFAQKCGVLDIFDGDRRAFTPTQVAERLQLNERGVALMLPMLSALEFLDDVGGAYRRREDADDMDEAWPRLETFVRTGHVPNDIDQPERRGSYYAKSVIGLAAMFEAMARELAETLPPANVIVDVGAGSGVWSFAMAARAEHTRVIAIDRPEVVTSTQQYASSQSLQARVTTIAGDYFETTLDAPVDRIVMANVLHLENEERAAHLIKRYADMLEEDGELVIVDLLAGPDWFSTLMATSYDMHLGMRTQTGRAHREEKLTRWCNDAGLTNHRVTRLQQTAVAAIVCSARDVAPRGRELATIPKAELDALREDRDRWRSRFAMSFDGSVDALVVIEKERFRVVNTNKAFRELLGAKWAAFEDHTVDEIVVAADHQRFMELLRGLAKGEILERRHHITMCRQDGSTFAAELTAYDPLVRSVVCFIVRDRDRLAQAEKLTALGELAGGLMHDLNTPLANIKSNCALARTLSERLRAAGTADERKLAALDKATSDAMLALADIQEKLASIEAFATLEGAALEALAPHFKTGLAAAICKRAGEAAK